MVCPSFSSAMGVSVPVTMMVSRESGLSCACAARGKAARARLLADRSQAFGEFSFKRRLQQVGDRDPARRDCRRDTVRRRRQPEIVSVRTIHPRIAERRQRQAGLLACGSARTHRLPSYFRRSSQWLSVRRSPLTVAGAARALVPVPFESPFGGTCREGDEYRRTPGPQAILEAVACPMHRVWPGRNRR